MRPGAVLFLCLVPATAWATDLVSQGERLMEGKRRFELHCGACHSLELPRAQHLDRNTWQWVIEDMIDEFGATWLTEEDQRLILDYLVKKHGPRE